MTTPSESGTGRETLDYHLQDNNGSKYKSDGERRIAEFLDQNNIRYQYEQGLYVIDKGQGKIWRPDFYLPEFAAHIEYYGRVGNADYDERVQHKQAVYEEMGLDVISTYPWTFCEDWPNNIWNELYQIGENRLGRFYEKRIQAKQIHQPYFSNTTHRSMGGTMPRRYT